MTKTQYIVVGSSILLFLVLYFGCETTPPGQGQVERTRMLQTEATDVSILLRDAHAELAPAQLSNFQALERELNNADDDSLKVEILEQLSGRWYENGYLALAGHYAQEIAERQDGGEAWSIAGTTYAICVQRAEQDKERSFCHQRAVRAFENAISIDPDNVDNRVNLALTYTEVPPPNEPMKGVLMLRELEQAYPESPLVLTSLARLAIKTGQYERAIQRLDQALELENDNLNAICLLARAHAGAGNAAEAQAYERRCRGSEN